MKMFLNQFKKIQQERLGWNGVGARFLGKLIWTEILNITLGFRRYSLIRLHHITLDYGHYVRLVKS